MRTVWLKLSIFAPKKLYGGRTVNRSEIPHYAYTWPLVSERSFQLERGGQWTKGKSCDNFTPTGPWLLTADEVADPHNLRLWLRVNGRTMQDGNTKNLIFNVYYVIYYLSQFMTLEAGDLILTGTPAGVGLGMQPP